MTSKTTDKIKCSYPVAKSRIIVVCLDAMKVVSFSSIKDILKIEPLLNLPMEPGSCLHWHRDTTTTLSFSNNTDILKVEQLYVPNLFL